jgi:hypothetical protein
MVSVTGDGLLSGGGTRQDRTQTPVRLQTTLPNVEGDGDGPTGGRGAEDGATADGCGDATGARDTNDEGDAAGDDVAGVGGTGTFENVTIGEPDSNARSRAIRSARSCAVLSAS